MNFVPLTLEHKHAYAKLWEACPEPSMDYTFVNLWGWQEFYDLSCCIQDDLCWLKSGIEQNLHADFPVYRAPVGNWHTIDWQTENMLKNGAVLTRVPESLVLLLEQALPGRVQREESRGQWEYLYDKEDLALLSGNKYHKKRNHVNSFKKHYGDVDYRQVEADNCSILEDILALQDEWCQWHECAGSETLQAENAAINQVLSHWGEFPCLVGGAIYVENALAAFSVGEKLGHGVLGVHFEKGRSGIRGVYQTMNTYFVQKAGADCTLINREQDLDEEGLRKAKLSYLPKDFLRKYILTIKPV